MIVPNWLAGLAGQQNIQEVYRVAEEAFHG